MAGKRDRLARKMARAEAALQAGRLDESAGLLEEVCRVTPKEVAPRRLLARCCAARNDVIAAEQHWRALVARLPNDPEGWAGVGLALHHQGRLADAVVAYRRSLAVYPDEANTQENLAAALHQQGRLMEAVMAYRAALVKWPRHARLHSSLLLALHYLPEMSQEVMAAEHRRWGEVHARVDQVRVPFTNPAEPGRLLRVGYLSPDFREHSVASFFLPLVAEHDRERFEVLCYSANPRPDSVSAEIRSLADGWYEVAGMGDDDLAARMRFDQVDLLVELAGHTAGNRLTAVARRLAPVQVTYLGYPDTTGMKQIDYRLVDEITDPPGAERWCIETLVRLPGSFLCYRPPADAPEVAPPPCEAAGYITFGSFNNLAKVNEEVVAAWAAILQQVPDSRLVLKSPVLDDPTTAERYRSLFAGHGVAGKRIGFLGRTARRSDHLAHYRDIDIVLDTFPYNGVTTTCEALWMGVPVVTWATIGHAGRVGASLLASVGQEHWVTDCLEKYVERAVAMAASTQTLHGERERLRSQMGDSPLCDGVAFVRKVEDAYREMWLRWCAAQPLDVPPQRSSGPDAV
jgi:protein O-GlcNAc transferase